MAKKVSFGDKVVKKKLEKNHIKLIRSGRSRKTGAFRFYEEIVQIPEGKSAEGFVKELLSQET